MENTYKRYLLFAYAEYYPAGGWNDYKIDSDSIDNLMNIFNKNCREDEYEWSRGHILDFETKKIIWEVSSETRWKEDEKGIMHPNLSIEWDEIKIPAQ